MSEQPAEGATPNVSLQHDVDKLRQDIASLKDSLARVAFGATAQAADAVRGAGQTATEQMGATASGLLDTGSDLAASAKDQALTLASQLESATRRNPLGAIGGALLVGIVLGMMSRGR